MKTIEVICYLSQAEINTLVDALLFHREACKSVDNPQLAIEIQDINTLLHKLETL